MHFLLLIRLIRFSIVANAWLTQVLASHLGLTDVSPLISHDSGCLIGVSPLASRDVDYVYMQKTFEDISISLNNSILRWKCLSVFNSTNVHGTFLKAISILLIISSLVVSCCTRHFLGKGVSSQIKIKKKVKSVIGNRVDHSIDPPPIHFSLNYPLKFVCSMFPPHLTESTLSALYRNQHLEANLVVCFLEISKSPFTFSSKKHGPIK